MQCVETERQKNYEMQRFSFPLSFNIVYRMQISYSMYKRRFQKPIT